jgi:hypothetical protein
METFPLPAKPTPTYTLFENYLGRWLLVLLPVGIIGGLLGTLALLAFLISTNYSVLGWIE